MPAPNHRPRANKTTHERSKEALARETDTAFDEVDRIYEEELSDLASDAKITQYLGVLATKRVRARLRKH
jgi:Protein of unknown function (DUF3562)